MEHHPQFPPLSQDQLKNAIASETKALEKAYLWLEEHMPPSFLDAVDSEMRMLIARNLLSFALQDHFTPIYFKHKIIVLTLDGADADLRILQKFKNYPIRYYRTFVSDVAPPMEKKGRLKIALLYFHDLSKKEEMPKEKAEELISLAKEQNPNLDLKEIKQLISGITPNFLRSMKGERLATALSLFFKAKDEVQCQYEVKQNEDWKAKNAPSLQIVMAWRNAPKSGFLYRLSKIIHRHGLSLQKVVGAYIDLSNTETISLLSLGLHGIHGKAAWEEADIDDLLSELVLAKYFETDDPIGIAFADSGKTSGGLAHFIRNMGSFIHQTLVYADPNLYSEEHITEGLCRHPDLTVLLAKLFEAKFKKQGSKEYAPLKAEFEKLLTKLDTGQPLNDTRRKNILRQGLNFIEHILKTNFYEPNKSGFSFRLDPKYMDNVPFERKEKFPELPFAIFFIRGMHYIGFNIRFRDLARGGVRTVIPSSMEAHALELNTIFSEGYNLAYTQQKKNKDIPEGGAKTVILLEPFEVFREESEILRKELVSDGMEEKEIEEQLHLYNQAHRLDYLYESQKSFIDCLLTLVNCTDDGKLKASQIVDYWKKPEYIYLGPDENMFNDMIVWIAARAVLVGYKPGRSFMSSKPGAGINHKEFGVTSFGVNVYMHEMLRFLNIDPEKQSFTIKMSGGPDGDVAGNELLNLYKFYPKTAKLLALTDGSGTIYDPEGLDLKETAELFRKSVSIHAYPAEKLHDGGFLLDLKTKKNDQTLLWTKKGGKTVQEYLANDEMNHLYRNNVHQIKADIFITGGGRPRTLNETNYKNYLDPTGKPTSRAIIEGANLYLSPGARRELEKLGVLIFKDSSCNKGGVICSSFEVLASLCMTEDEFLKNKTEYVKEVLELIGQAALNEARLLLTTHKKTGAFLTDLSDLVSEKINHFKDEILHYLQSKPVEDKKFEEALLRYCPPLLQKHYKQKILLIPKIHKQAIIACYLASHLIYDRGLERNFSLQDAINFK